MNLNLYILLVNFYFTCNDIYLLHTYSISIWTFIANDIGRPMKTIHPAHLDNLLDKEFGFRVKYRPDFKQSSIVKLIEDKQIIQMIKDGMVQPEVLLSFINY